MPDEAVRVLPGIRVIRFIMRAHPDGQPELSIGLDAGLDCGAVDSIEDLQTMLEDAFATMSTKIIQHLLAIAKGMGQEVGDA